MAPCLACILWDCMLMLLTTCTRLSKSCRDWSFRLLTMAMPRLTMRTHPSKSPQDLWCMTLDWVSSNRTMRPMSQLSIL